MSSVYLTATNKVFRVKFRKYMISVLTQFDDKTHLEELEDKELLILFGAFVGKTQFLTAQPAIEE